VADLSSLSQLLPRAVNLHASAHVLAKFAKTLDFGAIATMNESLPDDLKSFVDSQVNHGNYGSTSEYIRDLIRHDYDRGQLRDALIQGARSPIATEADTAYFESLRNQAQANT
jgi:antitoxin ParD1/3/4